MKPDSCDFTATGHTPGRRKLQTLTQADYNRLLTIVKAVIPPNVCDPADGLGHGLLIALEKYEANGPLTAFVPRCAVLYALQQTKKLRRQLTFSDLTSDEGFADYLDQVLPYLEDPRYVEGVDELFIRRIEEILECSYNWRLRYSTREATSRAVTILALFRDHANLGKGSGIDEYEQTPSINRAGRPAHNTKVVRRLIVDHLCEELDADRKDI